MPPNLKLANLFWGLICQIYCSPKFSTTVYTLIFAGLNFHGLPFRGFHVFIFAVCDVIAQALPVWSKFSRHETFADGY